MKLLSRDEFRTKVFERDGYKCVVCGECAILNEKGIPTNLDAHHIIERRLFTSLLEKGGYYIENGASLCEKHHIEAETTVLDCNKIRELCGIEELCIPEHFYFDIEYDKWGNIINPNGTRVKGELFYDESVQKILSKGNVLDLFTKYVKYPRTYHLPNSSMGKDDRQLIDYKNFEGKRIIQTLKLDGENSTFYNDYYHARSINSGSHESRNWVKTLWSQVAYNLDDDMRLCGENLYAVHTIRYENLGSYFKMFSFWIKDKCLSWDETKEYAEILNLDLVPVIYDGIFDIKKIEEAFKPYENEHEGYVIRLYDEFSYGNFRDSVAKYVRPDFRQQINNSHGHWISKKIEKNGL